MRAPTHTGAIAVGQYILVRRAAYGAIGGYAAPGLRDTFADDVRFTERIKRDGGRLDLVDGRDLLCFAQWATWGAAWRGWRKSIHGATEARPGLALVGGMALIGYGLLPSSPSFGRSRHGAGGGAAG